MVIKYMRFLSNGKARTNDDMVWIHSGSERSRDSGSTWGVVVRYMRFLSNGKARTNDEMVQSHSGRERSKESGSIWGVVDMRGLNDLLYRVNLVRSWN